MSWRNFKNYYVYTYFDENGIPYYVGMGCGKRVIQKHLYVKVPPIFEMIQVIDNLTQQDAWNKEIELISYYGREDLGKGPLKNLTNGGPSQKSGWKHSKLAKEKISIGNKGKIRTEDQKKNYKGTVTLEHANKVKIAVKKMWDDPEYKKQRLEKIKSKPFSHKGKPWSQARRDAQMKKQLNKGVSHGILA